MISDRVISMGIVLPRLAIAGGKILSAIVVTGWLRSKDAVSDDRSLEGRVVVVGIVGNGDIVDNGGVVHEVGLDLVVLCGGRLAVFLFLLRLSSLLFLGMGRSSMSLSCLVVLTNSVMSSGLTMHDSAMLQRR